MSIRTLLLLLSLCGSVLPSVSSAESAYIYIGGQIQETVAKPVREQAKNTYATGLQIGGYILAMFIFPVIIFLVVGLINLMGLRLK